MVVIWVVKVFELFVDYSLGVSFAPHPTSAVSATAFLLMLNTAVVGWATCFNFFW